MPNRLKVSGVVRVDDPSPRIRIETGSPYVFLDRADVAVLVEMIEAPAPVPPLFSVEEQRHIADEYHRRANAEQAASAARRAAEEADFRARYPSVAEKLL